MENQLIKDATIDDASLIADAILSAIGEDMTINMGGDKGEEAVHEVFKKLAAREDTQYSYRNVRIAVTKDGQPMGVCISYDGDKLRKLRVPFFEEARKTLDWKITDEEVDKLPGETDSGEFYLDSLMTLPEFRNKGVGKSLILDALAKAKGIGKPLGLLCDYENPKARKLYESIGFKEIGSRPFAGHMMAHMQL